MSIQQEEAERRVHAVIREAESKMPLCYTEETYKIVLGNKISDIHIANLKNKTPKQMIESTLPLEEKTSIRIGGPRA